MKKKTKKKYSMGTGKNGVVRHYIESPQETLVENDIAMARAREKAMSNGWAQGLDILGNLGVQYGTSMMTSAGTNAIGAGGKGANGGIVAGGGDGGAFGQGFGDWMGNNSQNLASGLSMLPMLANLMGPGFAFGGQVPVEVEGEEVGETPNGQLIDFQGPSHENGGIDISLPGGTEIFSKRIKVGGKTMAERKMAREKKLLTLEKLLEKSGDDIVLKNSIKRTKKSNDQEEAKDQQIQDMIGGMKKMAKMAYGTGPDGVQMMAGGGPVFDWMSLLQSMNPQIPTITGTSNDFHGEDPYKTSTIPQTNKLEGKTVGMKNMTPTASMPNFAKNAFVAEEVGDKKAPNTGEGFKLPNFTAGDITGLAGTLYSAFAPMKNTLKNRAGDTPNVNMFEDFGNDALDRINEAKGYVATQRDKALKDLETSRTRTTKSNRNTARGVNTLRALDLASDVNANKAQDDIYDTFSRQMMELVSKEAGFENQQDQAVMAGEQNRDLADRQDRDNFYTQMAQDIATKGEGIQTVGKMLNQNKSNTMAEKAINDSSINFKYTNGVLTDKAGNPVMTEVELAKAAKTMGITVEEYIKLITEQNG